MNPNEYRNLAQVEQDHWFYAGKRSIVRYWIHRLHPLDREDVLIDCGAGTGSFATEMSAACHVIALDDHAEALAFLRARLGTEHTQAGSCVDLPLPADSADVLTALDVLEHLQDDHRALAEFARVLRPGGLAIITVPASPRLWSDWDVSLHHYRRYTRRSLLAIVPPAEFEVILCQYINALAYPLVFLARRFRSLKRRLGRPVRSRSEDTVPPRPINALLRWSLERPACQRLVRFPFGVGLLAALRRR
jgi:SAM-dependent methyltransferase